MTGDYDVAVVGLGPVGGILANLLGMQGLRVGAFDRSPAAPQLPRGVGIDAEIMRVVQALGLAAELEPLLKVFRGAQYLDVDGQVVSTRPGITGPGPQGWAARYNVHQPDLENVLRAGLTAHPSLDLRLGWDVGGVRNLSGGGAELTASVAGSRSAEVFTARYVVGCDGARSTVRKAANLALDDFGLEQPWIVADFEVSGSADLPGINTHYADPEQPVIYIHVVRNLRRFEFRAAPGEDLEKAVDPEAIWRRVSRWLSADEAVLVRAAVYTHRALVARRWREGALIVAGDAAHQTPPFLGQGLCAGVRDAASLAWRLGAIVHDGAPDTLVDSYQSERNEHARFIIATAASIGTVLTAPDKAKLNALNARIGREGTGQSPRLGPGLWQHGGPGGTLAPQPRLADGRLLDDVVGFAFAAVATPRLLAGLGDPARRRAEAAGVVLVEATGEAATWLSALEAGAVVVRPDRYYYGTFTASEDLGTALIELADSVAPCVPAGA